tara:strand:- start:2871 stop:3149 length:279 start_codon:yes stop_codon:yes gene_type:complete
MENFNECILQIQPKIVGNTAGIACFEIVNPSAYHITSVMALRVPHFTCTTITEQGSGILCSKITHLWPHFQLNGVHTPLSVHFLDEHQYQRY